eukprot:scaffold6124_cov122-Cylindrotheca_fusiformis.AAC.35
MEDTTPTQEESAPLPTVELQSAAGEATSAAPRVDSAAPEQPPNENETTTKKQPDSEPVAAAPKPAKAGTKKAHSLDDARKELSVLVNSKKITADECQAIKATLQEHTTLKEKVDKLKSLLGRSAKAQRETKVDFDASQKRLGQALREIERLNQRLEKLQSRPSHLDLLMDFETNFDKALLSVGQPGGEQTSAAAPSTAPEEQDSALDTMLMNELGEARSRIEKLEELNSAMMSRSTQLESTTRSLQTERDEARRSCDRLQMELKMAKMEAEHATRAMQDKAASLEEMQMEIDLVLKANKKASSRAAAGEAAVNSLKTDKQRVQQLEGQIQALQEWALASAESKRLVQERCAILENKLRQIQGRSSEEDNAENILFKKNGSMVIGAGDVGKRFIELGDHGLTVDARFVVLRWKFDFSPSDNTISFNIMKGKCTTASEEKKATYLIKDRVITGGAGGETELAFTMDNACTILWSNRQSWIRPRTVTYSVEVVSLK